jgi:glycosyltransferase involved in cell wall biosynthesis
MKISVVIPAYNAAASVDATIRSVLAQSVRPDEILVLDDGSTDDTFRRLDVYRSEITVLRQSNGGVAHARNVLCERARGEIIAFLDADDTWHPSYLEVQRRLIEEHPNAVAYFTQHEDLVGYADFPWKSGLPSFSTNPKRLSPLEFLRQYNRTPLSFQMSCFCILKKVLTGFSDEPFPVSISGADDTYLHNILPLAGLEVVHCPAPLVAYRIIGSSISSDRLKMSRLVVRAFQMLEAHYKAGRDPVLFRAFQEAYASRLRDCGKFLMGASRTMEARGQFWQSAQIAFNARSIMKSIGLLCLSYCPLSIQPRWPSSQRPSEDRQKTQRQ